MGGGVGYAFGVVDQPGGKRVERRNIKDGRLVITHGDELQFRRCGRVRGSAGTRRGPAHVRGLAPNSLPPHGGAVALHLLFQDR